MSRCFSLGVIDNAIYPGITDDQVHIVRSKGIFGLGPMCPGMTDCQASSVRMLCVRVYQISGYFLSGANVSGYDRFPGIFFCVLYVQVRLMTRFFHVVTTLQMPG